MLKKVFAFALIILSYKQNYSQELKSYTQAINETKLQFDMQAIPAGKFKMGSVKEKTDKKPIHDVNLMLSGLENMRLPGTSSNLSIP